MRSAGPRTECSSNGRPSAGARPPTRAPSARAWSPKGCRLAPPRPRADLSAYAFQLRAYALAARAITGRGARVRAGILFLGGASEPTMLDGGGADGALANGEHDAFATELAALGARLAAARWSDRWAGVPVETCKALRCGFVPACHGRLRTM